MCTVRSKGFHYSSRVNYTGNGNTLLLVNSSLHVQLYTSLYVVVVHCHSQRARAMFVVLRALRACLLTQ